MFKLIQLYNILMLIEIIILIIVLIYAISQNITKAHKAAPLPAGGVGLGRVKGECQMNEQQLKYYRTIQIIRDWYADSDEETMRSVAPALDEAIKCMKEVYDGQNNKEDTKRVSNSRSKLFKRLLQTTREK